MFFPLSKILWFFASPSNLTTTFAFVGLVLLFTRYWRAGRAMTAIGLFGLLLFGLTPLPNLLVRGLEDRFPAVENDSRPVDGIIVLGGAIFMTRDAVKLNDAGARMTEAMALATRFPDAKIVFTGGSDSLMPRYTEAWAARILFRSLGLADQRVIYEDQSRNTRENALFTQALVSPKPGERWLLVTSAFHMARAVGCFRAVGLDVVAYPVDFQSEGTAEDYWRLPRSWSAGLRTMDLAVKEWVGLIIYRLVGYTDALLPAPGNAGQAKSW